MDLPLSKNTTAAQCSFTPGDFEKIAAFARTHFGLSLSESKVALLQSRLRKRMVALDLLDFPEYFSTLEGPSAELEKNELLSVLTTNVTQFFREDHHFDLMKSKLLEPLIKAARTGSRVRIWSAGCSTGQEAVSIAMILLDHCPEAFRLDLKILATDIDPQVIEKAKLGYYSARELSGIPSQFLRKYIQMNNEEDGGTVEKRVQRLITYRVQNLIDPLPFNGPFDLIFCRNVAIYFDREIQQMLWQKISNVLKPGGYFFVGHSEHISGPAVKKFKKMGVTTYRRYPS